MKKEVTVPDFVKIENDILKYWKDKNCFHKLMKQNEGHERFRFLDGPITANNRAGVHHFWGRVLKDVTLKYQALKGKSCQFQNGFDAQGLWVEVNVEKELGLNGKPEILKYGIDNFTNKCMERVKYFANEITNQSIRMGQWMDWNNSYFTNSDENITSIWHFLKKCDEKGWIVKKNRPMVWCPRCGTSLSDHEVSGSYKEVTHTAIFVKLPVIGKDFKMVAWTTTPWTLTANVALAVNPEFTYALVRQKSNGEKLVMNKDAIKRVLKDDAEILDEFKGDTLVGLTYETCFPELVEQNFVHKVVAWDQVDNTEGSGVVHIAPGCGAEDFDLGVSLGLKEICPINEQGVLLDNCGFVAGKKTTEVVDDVVNRLKQDNKLLYAHPYKHSYPYCWRCKTDVVYKLVPAWFIKMDELRPQLLKAIDEVEFQPAYGKKRMIDWLNNMGDWNISRSRFYGLPLPFFVCEKCGKVHVMGSLEELKKHAVNPELVDKLPNIHRPWIDDIKIKCPDCGEEISRIPDVGDVWLDAGITPFSTKKYFTDKEYFKNNFPSDYVCEMVEQIKLWFYSLLIMSVVLTGKAPYKKICTYQYVKDENGGEFHKSGGNTLDADAVADKTGADTIRYLYAAAPIGNDMRFGYNLTDEARRKLLGFWNIYTFFNTYACIDNPDIKHFVLKDDNLTESDKWLLESINKFIEDSDRNYAEHKSYLVVKDFEKLVDDMSNFYIRVNRKRFWKSDDYEDQMTAYTCLYRAIKAMISVMAPAIPFMTEYIWQNLVREIENDEKESIMLGGFPTQVYEHRFGTIIDDVARARDVIAIALKLRNEKQLKVKQPLKTLYLVVSQDVQNSIKKLENIVKDELNIKDVVYEKDNTRFNKEFLSINFRTAGAILKGDVQKLKNELALLSDNEMENVAKQVKTGKVSVGSFKDLDASVFTVAYKAKDDYVISTESGYTVVLDITIDEELTLEGLFRELVRQAQILRKEADFRIEQRIKLAIDSNSEIINKVVAKYKDRIVQDVLVSEFNGKIVSPDLTRTVEVGGEKVTLTLKAN